MLPRALIGHIKPENWLGFIDAIYAIILTLLLIELPSQVLELIKVYEKYPNLHWNILNGFFLTFFGYLSIFIIIYDVWAHHRVVVAQAALNRINLSLGILILFLSSLLPPLYHVFSMLKYESLAGRMTMTSVLSSIYFDARLALYLTGLCIYGSIAFIAAKDVGCFRRLGGVAESRMVALKRLKSSSIAMMIVLIVVGLLSLTGTIKPPIPLVLIAVCTHLPVDNLMLQVKRKIVSH